MYMFKLTDDYTIPNCLDDNPAYQALFTYAKVSVNSLMEFQKLLVFKPIFILHTTRFRNLNGAYINHNNDPSVIKVDQDIPFTESFKHLFIIEEESVPGYYFEEMDDPNIYHSLYLSTYSDWMYKYSNSNINVLPIDGYLVINDVMIKSTFENSIISSENNLININFIN